MKKFLKALGLGIISASIIVVWAGGLTYLAASGQPVLFMLALFTSLVGAFGYIAYELGD